MIAKADYPTTLQIEDRSLPLEVFITLDSRSGLLDYKHNLCRNKEKQGQYTTKPILGHHKRQGNNFNAALKMTKPAEIRTIYPISMYM